MCRSGLARTTWTVGQGGAQPSGLRASNDKATLRASLSRARVCRPPPASAMRVTQVQKPDIRLRNWCAMKCEPPRFSDEENGSRVSDCIASRAEATSRLVWRVSSLNLGAPSHGGAFPFFVFLARRGRGDDRQRPIVNPLSALASTLLILYNAASHYAK